MICRPTLVGAIFFNIAFVMAVCSYLRAACTDPGSPETPEWMEWSASNAPNEWDASTKKRGWNPGNASKCDICYKLRPERAHHCNICGVCILRMDHHCPWIGNCVGWRNHKFFILLTWWSMLSCVLWLTTMNGPDLFASIDALEPSSNMSIFPLAFIILTGLLLMITGGMAFYSMHMAMRNITAIEQLFKGENPYQCKTILENLEQLLGPIDFWLFLPVLPAKRSNGSSFPVVNAIKPEKKSPQEILGCGPGVRRPSGPGTTSDGCGVYGATGEGCRAGIKKPSSPRNSPKMGNAVSRNVPPEDPNAPPEVAQVRRLSPRTPMNV